MDTLYGAQGRRYLMTRVRCKNCKTILESPDGSGLWTACDCYNDREDTKGIWIDDIGYGNVRIGGNPSSLEWLDDKEEE